MTADVTEVEPEPHFGRHHGPRSFDSAEVSGLLDERSIWLFMKGGPATVTSMHVVLGDKRRFAAEVGEAGALCRVDLWAAGRWLTCDDNMAYVPQFRRDVLNTAAWLRSGRGSPIPFAGVSAEAAHRQLMLRAGDDDEPEAGHRPRSRFRVFLWGPTTDNVTAYLFREEDRLVITLGFWREEHLINHPEDAGAVFVLEIPTDDFIGILEGIAAALDAS
ncbi:hypothetical protein [Streptomyces mutomycini]|uniref:hypothetical protein n=1 Tax=Streptomyces mutomycini TaxID=284036 RepID=UPI003400E5F7